MPHEGLTFSFLYLRYLQSHRPYKAAGTSISNDKALGITVFDVMGDELGCFIVLVLRQLSDEVSH